MKYRILFLFLCVATFAKAQQYTFIQDRRFFVSSDLIGYDFKPAQMEIQNEFQEEISAGEYSFGITQNHLYVKGGDIQGVYNINNIQPEDYGFKLSLMNARDARLQGHLKVILNKFSMVEVIIFKRSPDEKEIIFYLTPISKKLRDTEKAYFTDRGETILTGQDSLWGKSIQPFLIIHEDERVQQRMRMEDSLSILFVEEIKIVEKEKKRSKKEKAQMLADSTAMDSIGIVLEEMDSVALDSFLNLPDVKVKITKEYYVVVRSNLKYLDGSRQIETVKYPVKKVQEKEDETAGPMQERYLWEFVNDKKELVQLFLNGDHSVSTMQVGPKKYLMRGF